MDGKITLKLPKAGKPRNPLALAARQRRAGAHETDDSPRRRRRAEKQQLRALLAGRKVG